MQLGERERKIILQNPPIALIVFNVVFFVCFFNHASCMTIFQRKSLFIRRKAQDRQLWCLSQFYHGGTKLSFLSLVKKQF